MRLISSLLLAALVAAVAPSCLRLGLDPRVTRGVAGEDGGADAPPAEGDADGAGDADGVLPPDGDADADGDAEVIEGDADSADADAPCEASECEETPCRLVEPQCGCCPGLACQRPDGDDPRRECVPPGAVGPLERCSVNADCTTGYVCVSATSAPGMCVRYCFASAECPTHSVCSEMIVATEPVGSCTAVCDPLSGAGCPAGTACIAVNVRRKDDDAIVAGSLCGPDSMLPVEGESCAGIFACQQGSTCVDGTCQQLCVLASPSCPPSTSCGALSGGYSLGGVEYGSCR